MYPINYYIALGTNIGNYKNNFSRAVLELKKIGNIVKQANIYKSKPYGYLKQNYFYNSMVQVRSLILPMQFMVALQLIEKKLQKNKKIKNGPRKIDLENTEKLRSFELTTVADSVEELGDILNKIKNV